MGLRGGFRAIQEVTESQTPPQPPPGLGAGSAVPSSSAISLPIWRTPGATRRRVVGTFQRDVGFSQRSVGLSNGPLDSSNGASDFPTDPWILPMEHRTFRRSVGSFHETSDRPIERWIDPTEPARSP